MDHRSVSEHPGPIALQRLRDAVRRIGLETRGRRPTGVSHEDADDISGTFASDSALGFDPFPLLEALDRHGAPTVVMGQVAGIMHGSSELTGDLDLLWPGHKHQAPDLAEAFASVGALLSDEAGSPVPCAPSSFHLPKVLFQSPTASGDCCTPALPWGDLDIPAIIDRADSVTDPSGFTIRFINVHDLITMRRSLGHRPKDHRRATELEQLNATPP